MSKSNQANSKLTDEQVVKKVVDGDKDSYAEIVRRYQVKLLRYANRFVHDDDKAADVVQEVFIKSYINLNSFKLDKKFSSWIYRITHNEAVNYLKKHAREVRPDDEDWFDRIPSDISTDKEVDQILLKHMLAKHIAKLPRKYQDPIILHYLEGQSYQEISDVLKMPTATVGTRINRAKAQLKVSLTVEGISYEW